MCGSTNWTPMSLLKPLMHGVTILMARLNSCVVSLETLPPLTRSMSTSLISPAPIGPSQMSASKGRSSSQTRPKLVSTCITLLPRVRSKRNKVCCLQPTNLRLKVLLLAIPLLQVLTLNSSRQHLLVSNPPLLLKLPVLRHQSHSKNV